MSANWDDILEKIQAEKAASLAKLRGLMERIHRGARVITPSDRVRLDSERPALLRRLLELAKQRDTEGK